MYCTSCGHANDNNAYKCVACGAVLQGHAPEQQPAPSAATPSSPMPPAPSAQRLPERFPPQSVPFNQRPSVPNYLVWAILSTLCCCLPGGIVAIVYASQVDGKLAMGDIAGAQASSHSAAVWCWVSAGLGLLTLGGYGVLVMFNGFGHFGH